MSQNNKTGLKQLQSMKSVNLSVSRGTLWERFQQNMFVYVNRFCSFTCCIMFIYVTGFVYVVTNFSHFLNFYNSFHVEISHLIIFGIQYKIISKEISNFLPKLTIQLQFGFISLKAE